MEWSERARTRGEPDGGSSTRSLTLGRASDQRSDQRSDATRDLFDGGQAGLPRRRLSRLTMTKSLEIRADEGVLVAGDIRGNQRRDQRRRERERRKRDSRFGRGMLDRSAAIKVHPCSRGAFLRLS